MATILLCSFCRGRLRQVPYRYCTMAAEQRTRYKRLGQCCATPALHAALQQQGWTIQPTWTGAGTRAGASQDAGTSPRQRSH